MSKDGTLQAGPDLVVTLATVIVLGGCAWFFLMHTNSRQSSNSVPSDLKNAGDFIIRPKTATDGIDPNTAIKLRTDGDLNEQMPLILKSDLANPAYEVVGFNVLAKFPYFDQVGNESSQLPGMNAFVKRDQIPRNIRALNKHKLAVRGYMVPWGYDEKLNTTMKFQLAKDRSICCLGAMPKLNDYIIVHMQGNPAPVVKDRLVTVYGTLEVDEKSRDGLITSIYNMTGDEVLTDDDL